MTTEHLIKLIETKDWEDTGVDIPQSWRSGDAKDVFIGIGKRLIKKGIKHKDVLLILSDLYAASSVEFGV